MPSLNPFTPSQSVVVTVAASSAALTLPTSAGDNVMISSIAANAIAYFAFGTGSTTVVIPTGTPANGTPILPGTVQVFTIPSTATHIITIGTAGNTLVISRGDGQ